MVDGAGIVHMRGRIYDPRLGRFLQADPIVQDPLNAQSYNRYTYVFNNPLSLIDPSGYRSLSANLELYWKPITAIAIVVATSGQAGLALKAGAAGEALAWAVVGGAGAGLVTTGTLRGTVMGAADGLLTFGIGEGFKESTKALLLAQSLKGGLLEGLNGGDFGHGFVTAGLSKATGLGISGLDLGPASSIILNAMAGGTVSAATGGKFANGAVSAAVQFAFNQLLSDKDVAGWKGTFARLFGYQRPTSDTTSQEQLANMAQAVNTGAEMAATGLEVGYKEVFVGTATGAAGGLALGSVKVLGSGIMFVFTRPKLQHVFEHSADFGIKGSANNKTLAALEGALNTHVNAAGTISIAGTYRGTLIGNALFEPFVAIECDG